MESMGGIWYQSTLQRHCIINVKEKLVLQQQVFPTFSMIAMISRKNIFIVNSVTQREINMALNATQTH